MPPYGCGAHAAPENALEKCSDRRWVGNPSRLRSATASRLRTKLREIPDMDSSLSALKIARTARLKPDKIKDEPSLFLEASQRGGN